MLASLLRRLTRSNTAPRHDPDAPATTPPTFCEPLEPRRLLSVAIGALNASYTFHDADGDMVTVTLKGPGSATLTLDGDAATDADLQRIDMQDTTGKTKLDIKVKRQGPNGDGMTAVGFIHGQSAKQLNLRQVILDEDGVHMTGSLERFAAAELRNGADVIVEQASGKKTQYTLEKVTSGPGFPMHNFAVISTPDEIKKLDVRDDVLGLHLSGGADGGRIRFRGGMTFSVIEFAGDVKQLGLGASNDVDVLVGGDAKKLDFAGGAVDLRTRVGGAVKQLKQRGGEVSDSRFDIAGELNKAQFSHDVTGGTIISATAGIGKFDAKRSFIDSMLLAGTMLDVDFGLDGAVFGAATIDQVRIKRDLIDAIVSAGADPGPDRLFELGDTLPGSVIKRIDIGGQVAGIASPHPNPGIYAADLGRLKFASRVGAAVVA